MTHTRGPARCGHWPIPLFALLLSCAAHPGKPARARRPIDLVLPALDGGQIELSRLRGRVVVLHVFTTWSMASQADVDQLITAHRAYPSRLRVVGLALDPDGYRLVAPWRTAMRIPYLIALSTEAVRSGRSSLGRIREVPTTILVDSDGTVAATVEGPLARRQLRELLADLGLRE